MADKVAEAAEASKAEADKKAAEASKANGAGGSDEADDEEPAAKTYTAAEMKEVRDEAKRRRLENKKLLEEKENWDKAKEFLGGKKEDGKTADPIAELKAKTETKLRNALLRSNLATLARDAHDPALLLNSFASAFKEVEVDVDGETVDEEQLTAVVAKLRKSKPFLFQAPEDLKKQTTARLPPDGKGGQPASNGTERAHWNKLNEAGDVKAATEYYAKHKALILQQMRD